MTASNVSNRFLLAGVIFAALGFLLWSVDANWLLAALSACIGVALLIGWGSAEVRRRLTAPDTAQRRMSDQHPTA